MHNIWRIDDTEIRSRPKAPLWARLFLILGVVLLLGGGIVVIANVFVASYANHRIGNHNLLGDAGAQAQAPEHHVTVVGAKNILLVGLDARPAQNPNDLVRADSIILLHIPANHDQAYLVSIPRDTYVHIPADRATGWGGGYEKINAAYAFGRWHGGGTAGGVNLLAKTIQSLGGPAPDAAAVIDFTGFQQVVAALGGVYLCVDETTTSIHIGFTRNHVEKAPFYLNSDGTVRGPVPGVTPVVYPKGLCKNFPAWQALDYVRQRDLLANHDLDYGRQRHQQQFLKAVFKKLFSLGTFTNPLRLNRVLGALGKAMTIDDGGISPSDWAYAMRAITPAALVTVKTNDGQLNPRIIGGISYELLSNDSRQLIGSLNHDTVGQFIQQHPTWVSAAA
ncbi:MAG: LCP family protein [Micromonosporaceae bacterium]|nr:LCP family protein [Micromonosporaceae bacterium]